MAERAAKKRQKSGDSHPAEDLVANTEEAGERKKDAGETHVFMVLNGKAPPKLKPKLVTLNESYKTNEAKEIFTTLYESQGSPVVCGFDCASDVKKWLLRIVP